MRAGFVRKIAFLFGGLVVWAAHFLLVYGANGVVCARKLAGTVVGGIGIVPAIVAGATIVAVAAVGAIGLAALAGRGPGIAGEPDPGLRAFWRFTTLTIAGLALVSILWTAVPVLVIRPCS